MSRRTGPSREVALSVVERDGMCRRCRNSAGAQIHHRKPRGAGGSSDPRINSRANLVWLCSGCHAEIESFRNEARDSGWLVRFSEDPETVPLVDLTGSQFWLTDDDGVIFASLFRSG